MTPTFSIILPTYNCANIIKNSINSILKQTYKNFEIIVMDNLSSDDTISNIKKNNDSRIKIISEKDLGIYDAMNKGIKHATGEWLYFMGSDDLLYDSEVLLSVKKKLKGNLDIVYGDVIWQPDNYLESGEWTYEKLLYQNINHQRIFYKKKVFENHKPFNLNYNVAADYELNIRLFCSSNTCIKYAPITISYFCSNGFSSNKIDFIYWKNWEEIVLANFQNVLDKNQIYSSLVKYCWILLDQNFYIKSFIILLKILFNTYKFGILKLYSIKLFKTIYFL